MYHQQQLHLSKTASSKFLKDKNFKSDEAFKQICRDVIKMNRQHVKENNELLKGIILNKIVKLMRETDRTFDELCENVIFGGSFYKNLKVSKPDEYDLYLVIKLPIEHDHLKIDPDPSTPGYVKIRVPDSNLSRYENFWNRILTKDYLDQNKFRSWIQSVLDRALVRFQHPNNEDKYVITCHQGRSTYEMQYQQHGPAFTMNVKRMNHDQRELSFDLVPCLLFRDKRHLPGFRPHNEKWITIAKPLNRQNVGENVRFLWRAGFYDDEKKILAGHNKPVIRIMKKLRDIKQWHQLKSYFIETLFLHELKDPNFANNCERASRTNVLMHMLRVLHEKLYDEEITSYWHEGLNMLEDLPRLQQIANELKTIINRIDNDIKADKGILLEIFNLRL